MSCHRVAGCQCAGLWPTHRLPLAGARSSPLGLRPFDDVVHELLDRQAAALGIGALGILAFGPQTLPRKEYFPLSDIENLDIDGDLQPPARGRGLCAEGDWN